MSVRLAVFGAAGRMGRAVLAEALAASDLEVAAALEAPGHAALGQDAAALVGLPSVGVAVGADPRVLAGARVAIDFSSPAGAAQTAKACRVHGVALVLGTTGLAADAEAALDALARERPVVQAANFSVGVAVLAHLAAEAARLLGPAYDAEVIEMHHRHKKDAPSGTALRLADAVRDAKAFGPETLVTGRKGDVGPRPTREIGVFALRGGDVIGDHTVVLAGAGERLELTHRAHERSLFAAGALRAARWAAGQKPGRYAMEDVLGLRS